MESQDDEEAELRMTDDLLRISHLEITAQAFLEAEVLRQKSE